MSAASFPERRLRAVHQRLAAARARMAEEARVLRAHARAQAADLHFEFLAVQLEHRALLVELRQIHGVAGLQGLQVDFLAEVLLPDDARARFLARFRQAAARFLHRGLARVDALVVELLFQLVDDVLGLAARAAHERGAFLPRFFDEVALLFVEIGLLCRDLFFERLRMALALGDVGVHLLVEPLLLLEVADDVLELRVVGADELFRAQDDAVGEAEALRDRERVARARDADEQAVRRTQALDVELDAGILDAVPRVRERLELGIMRRRDRRRANREQALEDGHGERRALLRVRAGAELVDEHEVFGARFREDRDDMRHVRGKCGKALLDALLVADVGVDVVVDRDLGALRHGQEAAALRHEHHEAERLHADRLAARVRARDEQHGKARAELDVDGHDIFVRDQRMARGEQPRLAAVRQLRLRRLHALREPRFRKGKIDLRQYVGIRRQRRAFLLHLERQALEDARDFALLGQRQLLHVVAGLDDGHRLDEERRARRGLVVHDAGEKAAVLGLDRQHVALVADRHDGILEMLLMLRRVEDRADAVLDARLGRRPLAADAAELDTRVIAQLAVLVDGVIEAALELAEQLEAMRGLLQQRRVRLERFEKFLDIPRRIEEAPHVDELVERQRRAELHLLQHRPQVADAAERRRRKARDPHRLRRLREPESDLRAIGRWRDSSCALLAEDGGRAVREHRADAVVFQSSVGCLFQMGSPFLTWLAKQGISFGALGGATRLLDRPSVASVTT